MAHSTRAFLAATATQARW